MQISKQIVTSITKFMENRQSSQTEIAEYCGVSQPQISRAISTRQCSPELADKLLDFIEHKSKEIAKREAEIKKRLSQLQQPIA